MALKKRTASKSGSIDGASTAPSSSGPAESSLVIKAINKKYGSTVVRKANVDSVVAGRLRTGILTLDLALGGGLVLSSGACYYGDGSAGKSTLALITAARMQRAYPDMVVALIDLEITFDHVWATKLGVDCERLMVVEPASGEEAVEICEALLQAEDISMLIVDSVPMLTPMRELDSTAGDAIIGVQAKLMASFLRKTFATMLNERRRKHYPIVLYLNQPRREIGPYAKEILPGGKLFYCACSQIIRLSNKEVTTSFNTDVDLIARNEHTFAIKKNKTGGKFNSGKFSIVRDSSEGYPAGYVDQTKTMLTFAGHAGLYTGGGSSHTIEGCGKFKSHAEIGQFFYENPEKFDALQVKVLLHYRDLWNIR